MKFYAPIMIEGKKDGRLHDVFRIGFYCHVGTDMLYSPERSVFSVTSMYLYQKPSEVFGKEDLEGNEYG